MPGMPVSSVAGMHVGMLLDPMTSFASAVDVMYMMKWSPAAQSAAASLMESYQDVGKSDPCSGTTQVAATVAESPNPRRLDGDFVAGSGIGSVIPG
jgi:hypothetical protein